MSSGALVCATFLGCEAGFTKLSDMYRCHEIFVHRRPWLSYAMRQFLDESLPLDIHENATARPALPAATPRGACPHRLQSDVSSPQPCANQARHRAATRDSE